MLNSQVRKTKRRASHSPNSLDYSHKEAPGFVLTPAPANDVHKERG
jgi:hypothetical protein